MNASSGSKTRETAASTTERLEVNLKRVSKYSIKRMNAHEEIAVILAHEKDAAIRLAAAVGASAHDAGYVTSYDVALEQCCSILLERPL
ncbi:hypothetical protein F442_22427 [Phytophthora nicotianae P10297]|uniref:Uncharacterized protein n=5 Tax=Phytophthora nicotianae TaxID=4792 RepID=W2RAN6_PHYN3|nr:hypothetical protein PPTG_02412 [Phytophthora nicotianae INRA-310]ETK95012.1 hypothetical protein L915_02030 [Phytophthora nicotianae]ETO78808.1 hypothetical protein F444_06359 [Phytophthora nicotianae P1976]ETP28280.1 hypothetical protein F442_22427 [Phytophthora nicotianae P10297]ETM54691.1 hypothetical protein L914_02015 [Phytophthora nicotianae]ETN22488.1 hypothetical protein PPTG_02412 [Phytophthora nicotianae INRA-310]